ncbi:MAG: N-acetylglucosamine-6-phosphate deacetylase [Chloroflexi bacterium]|uniref:N-acetylglucosamine-6-phosphate deacetylase n=1 Tax=Candidatus Flexifilum breve TaxID=3140694 RepID=UPI003135C5BB|nr:N-acetylglucosamine-6-phosphate deacetylase [Chloroflexota bacterium]
MIPVSSIFVNAQIITPLGVIPRGWLLVRDGRIAAYGRGDAPTADSVIDAAGATLLPGFVDVHVHGGANFEAMDATPEALHTMSGFYARHGVTSFLATTWTDSRERIQAALETIAALTGTEMRGAALVGAHVEGPFLNPARCGAQSTTYIRRADRDEGLDFLNTGCIRLMAVAPEYPENHWLIRECSQRGIAVSAAHTAATYDDMCAAVELGLTQTTHTFNAMTGLHHREPGTLGAALTLPQLRCELIADNIHVHPAAMKLVWLAKGADGVILITDAVRGAGMPDGEYPIDDRVITIKDGAARLPDGTLAGSTLTFDVAVRNFMAATGEPLANIWQATSLNAARNVGISNRKGSIELGKDADLILVDERINVQLTMVEGRVVYRENA